MIFDMNREIEIPEGYEAKIDGNKVIFVPKESEDERIRNDIMEAVENWLPYERVEEIRFYLNKQKEQQPAEWSEEDEGMYELFSYVIELVEDCPDKEKVKNWIKEIKRRFINSDYRSVGLHYILKNNHKSWKPSEEQMRAVFDASERNDKLGSVLRSLYDDLKKL